MGELRFAVIAASIALTVTACGGDEPVTVTFAEACAEVEGCDAPLITYPGPQITIWRVLVQRDGDGAISITSVDEVDVPMAVGAPAGPLSGQHGLAALDAAGEILEAQRIRFPTTMLNESIGEHSDIQDLTGATVDVMGYLEVSPEVATLAVIDADGATITSMPAPEPGASPRLSDEGIGGARGALTQIAPGGPCNHVTVLGVDDIYHHPIGWEDEAGLNLREREPLREPTSRQLAVTRAAFGRMPPMLCAGVSRVAFVEMDQPRTGGRNYTNSSISDVIRINATFQIEEGGFDEASLANADMRARLMHTIVHETGHATHSLLDGVRDTSDPRPAWLPTVRSLAAQTTDNVRLRAGLSNEWLRVHQSFVDEGFAQPHERLTPETKVTLGMLTPEEMAARGVMSGYGSHTFHDDIAEFVTWPLVRGDYERAGIPLGIAPDRNDYACIEMRAHGEASVPGRLAAVYTKLLFMNDLGLIRPNDLMDCRGDSIDLPVTGPGFAIYQDGTLLRSFAGSPAGRIYDDGGDWKFEMTASGRAAFGDMEYDGELKLTLYIVDGSSIFGADTMLEDVPWPRGVYQLGDVSSENTFELTLPDAPAGTFIVSDGFALVAEASNDRIVGSVFVRQVRRPLAPSPLPVYDNYDPPLQFRFLLMN